MAAPTTLSTLLDSLTSSINSALEVAPKLSGVAAPKDGISLFDTKNELMLSYLQNLVFLILLKLRQSKAADNATGDKDLCDLVVRKLVELRLYLDKGVRPLEDKLKYQVDKVLRAAEDAERNAQAAEALKQANEKTADSESGSDSEDASDAEDQGAPVPAGHAADLMNRPRLSAFVRNTASKDAANDKDDDKSGIYRPPRLNPTVMPTTERREERRERRPMKSATLDEFIADELSAAPLAEPSIGTTIMRGGREMKSAAERAAEEERRAYEESNFVRLPKESKKDRAKKAATEGKRSRMQFGGEEWRDLDMGVDRINRLTKGKSVGGTRALLEKSRKRGLDTVDGPRGSGNSEGVQMGERYQKRLKVLEGGRRDRGKKR